MEEFTTVMTQLLGFDEMEVNEVFEYFDTNQNYEICEKEFIRGITS